MQANYIKNLIVAMGFAPQNGKANIYFKSYTLHGDYIITVDLNSEKIYYFSESVLVDKRIKLSDNTTSNFLKLENFVVLECIDRLLEKGYAPNRIVLEKTYPSGRGHSGKLDILVYDESSRAFLMIECKTWGSEYNKEHNKMLKDGGQLFSYYTQDTDAKYLCLYSSRYDNNKVEYKNNIVTVQKEWKELSNTKEVHEYWNKNFRDNGIFEEHSIPYNIKYKALTRGMLKDLKEEDSGKIFNQIMEILRHNVVSDKPNAFNKLLNLFVCKIIDEDRNDNEELEFQVLETDNDETLQMRLNGLYKKGMWRFLNINIIYHSEDDVKNAFKNSGVVPKELEENICRMVRENTLKSPNFAFKEVLDEKSFVTNAQIVREIVELLQNYRFRYKQKHQFLGDFFELLLNTSMKQEAGQFFTPVPITRFIISSLPLKEFVDRKIQSGYSEVLPYAIDYACGSGHFLTEYMEQVQNIIETANTDKALPTVKRRVQSWKDSVKFDWAKDYVYGIDLDDRLVKTTKVSAFFNGDGEANIIWANGLDNFELSGEYRDKLNVTDRFDKKNNGQFDILISNPPYSVEAFKTTLKNGENTFDLYKNLTDNSSEIECLFVERMKQLLKVGGWAGVILPSSILSNTGIHSKAREIIFKYFRIKAIAEMGSGTFMKTGTNTVILFLERRADGDHKEIMKAIDIFFENNQDVTVNGIENAFSKYVTSVYDHLIFEDYLSFINGKPNKNIKSHELYLDYKKSFANDMYSKGWALEKEKMLYFLLTYSQEFVLVKSGQKQEEKQFLGYEFSERRGHEGMKRLPNGTKLFDENGDLFNPRKVNSYIYRAFLNEDKIIGVDIDKELSKHLFYGRMSGFISYGTSKFDKVVNLNNKQNEEIESEFPFVTIESVCEFKYGKSLKEGDRHYGEYPVFGSNGIIGYHNEFIANAPFIVIGRKGSAGKVVFSEAKGFPIDTTFYVDEVKDSIIIKYLYHIFNLLDLDGLCRQMGVPGLNRNDVYKLKIPLPPLDVQQKIVMEIENIENIEKNENILIANIRNEIEQIIHNVRQYPYVLLDNKSVAVNSDSIQPQNTPDKIYTYVDIDSVSNGTGSINFSKKIIGSKAPSRARRLAKSGSTIISTVRPNLKAFVFIEKEIENCIYSTGFAVLNSLDENRLLNKWIYLNFMYSKDLMNQMLVAMPKSQYPSINSSDIKRMRIYVPTIDKQKELILEIDKHEKEIIKLKEHISALGELKNKVLKKYL